jgi:hypothetical protein
LRSRAIKRGAASGYKAPDRRSRSRSAQRFGPALTTFTMLAEHAGVQRHTLFAHFPDELSLTLGEPSCATAV